MTQASTAGPYDIGDLVTVSAEFRDADGALADPTTVVCKIKDGAGTETSYTYGIDDELVKDEVGLYHLDVSIEISGTFYYRFRGTGAAQAAEEGEFEVDESEFATP
jgi:hypothetical protein